MKLFFDFFTIIVFFIVYKFVDIYAAVASAMICYAIGTVFHLIKHKKLDTIQIVSFALIMLLGGATLIFRNATFFMWKPTAVYWLFAISFIGSHYIGEKPLIQRLMDKTVELPNAVWNNLSILWAIFFIVMGGLNLFVAYHFDTNTWVNFKLFGTLGLTLIFIIGQGFYMAAHLKNQANPPTKPIE